MASSKQFTVVSLFHLGQAVISQLSHFLTLMTNAYQSPTDTYLLFSVVRPGLSSQSEENGS
jgi:hypothetical protein